MQSIYRFIHASSLDPRWSDIGQFILGDGPPSGLFILVERDNRPWFVFTLAKSGRAETWFHVEAICWHGIIAVGFAERVYIAHPSGGVVSVINLDVYFSGFTYGLDWLLVATGQQILRIDDAGQVIWQSAYLAIDGVVIHPGQNGRISGAGDWDPPDGWRAFVLTLADGLTA